MIDKTFLIVVLVEETNTDLLVSTVGHLARPVTLPTVPASDQVDQDASFLSVPHRVFCIQMT